MNTALAHRFPVARRIAYGALFAGSLAAAIAVSGAGTWQIWVFLVLPDVALLLGMGRGLERGRLHPRAVPLYNALHRLAGPAALGHRVDLARPGVARRRACVGGAHLHRPERGLRLPLAGRLPGVSAERRDDIVRAALELLEEEGADALTMRRLADRLGVKAPSLYKHLAGKDDLEAALIAVGLEQVASVLGDAARGAPDPLAAIAAAYRGFAHAHPHLYRLLTERPLPRDRLPAGLEARAAAPLVEAAGSPDRGPGRMGVRARDGASRALRALPARRRSGRRLA